jgi:UTP:GlnB (protein PII) uridylyltransferase
MTIGERAEDVFYITDELGRQLPEATRLRLEEQLHVSLDLRDAAKIA